MEDSIEEGLRRGAAGDHIADLVERRLARTNHERQGETGIEAVAPTPLEVRRVDHPRGVVLTLVGDLDLATAPLLQEQLDPAADDGGAVVVDLSGLRFIDSSGLNTLVQTDQQLRASGGRLVLVFGSRAVSRVFELTKLDRYFEWCGSSSEALGTGS